MSELASSIRVGGRALSNGVMFDGPTYCIAAYKDGNCSVTRKTLPSGIHTVPILRYYAALLPVLIPETIRGKVLMIVGFGVVVFTSKPSAPTVSSLLWLGVFLGVAAFIDLIPKLAFRYKNNSGIWALIARIPTVEKMHRLLSYHGAEHKVANYFLKNSERTWSQIPSFNILADKLEAIKKEPITTVHCGTNIYILLILTTIAVSAALSISGIAVPGLVYTILPLALLGPVAEIIKMFKNSRFAPIIFYPGYLVQKYLVAYEPDDEQLLVALRAFTALATLEAERN